MMSNVEDLEKALKAGLLACCSLPLAVENAPFDRPAGNAPWAAMTILANVPSPATYGDGGQDAHDGIMQVDLYYPRLSGTKDVSAMARQITEHFSPSRVLKFNDTRVHIGGAGGARDNPDRDGYYCRSLTINWWARVDRPG
jgi:hypothetical protein